MRKLAVFVLILLSGLGLSACGNVRPKDTLSVENGRTENGREQTGSTEGIDEMALIQVDINGQKFEAELYDNEAAKQFVEMLPFQVDMEDLHNNEKYYYFSNDFQTKDQKMKEIHEGELFIYDNKCLVLFYESVETNYNYTPLGKISDITGLKDALGVGTASVSFYATDKADEEQASANDLFNFETKTVTLNSSYEMPIYGIGTYSLLGEECENSVRVALENGVRLIDTAHMYNNEENVGEVVRNSGIPREDIFVITKLYPNQFADAEAAIEEALKKLDIEIKLAYLIQKIGTEYRRNRRNKGLSAHWA